MIYTIILISLFCNGLFVITDEGMIGYPIRKILHDYLPVWLFKPLIGCIPCMASIWGVGVCLVRYEWELLLIPVTVICCVAASYTNRLLRAIFDYVVHL